MVFERTEIAQDNFAVDLCSIPSLHNQELLVNEHAESSTGSFSSTQLFYMSFSCMSLLCASLPPRTGHNNHSKDLT